MLDHVHRVRVELYGSLGATGHGHGSDRAVIMGLLGETPETVDTATLPGRAAEVREQGRIALLGKHDVAFSADDLVLHRRTSLPFHPNGLRFVAFDRDDAVLRERVYYSVGGGFVVDESAAGADRIKSDDTQVRYPFSTGAELLDRCARIGAADQRRDVGERVQLANSRRYSFGLAQHLGRYAGMRAQRLVA